VSTTTTPARETSKILELGEHKYEIRKLDARSASWILLIVSQRMLPSSVEGQFTGMPTGRTAASKEEFDAIQGMCLQTVGRIIADGAPAIPIFALPNKFTYPEMEYDLATVVSLTAAVLSFNLAPFFSAGGLQALTNTLQTMNPPTQTP